MNGDSRSSDSTADGAEVVDAAAFEPELPLPRVAPSAVRAATGGHDPAEPDDGAGRDVDDTAAGGDPGGSAAAEPESESEPEATSAAPEGAAEEVDEHARAWRAVPLQTRLEALLFAATEPLSLRRLANLAGDADTDDVRGALEALESHYRHSARAFSLQEIGSGYQLRTTPTLAGLVAGVGRKPRAETLSQAALETLAIVAYRQPVLRADVEKIRGVASGDILRTLGEKGLVRVAGRSDLPGAPLLYGTTAEFLEIFGLRDLKDLPSDRDLVQRPV